ncbi:MAG: Gfo/Idh/MocA family oxidoreductase [Verrucomicrobia bacterium]|nr:Gfo/Idh/MocA family oxidoreductase [Verrucomicrobiota bacterium]
MNRRIQIGLIGCGTVAQYGHLPAIAKTPTLKLVAVAELDAATREKVAAQYGVAACADYRDLLARRDIQAVSVCTRVATHYEIGAAALRAGQHVFCEKPMADTPRRCRQLVALARKCKRLFAVNFEYRFDDDVCAMQQCIASGELGRLQVMRFVYNWSAHGARGPTAARRAAFMQNGGGSMDCGVHYLDLARFLSGSEFEAVSAMGQWVEPQFRYPGHILIQARMRSGALAHIEASFVYTHHSRAKTFFMRHEIIGERGIVSWMARPPNPERRTVPSLPHISGELQIITARRAQVKSVPFTKHFDATYAEWAQCLRRGTMKGARLAAGEDGARAAAFMWRVLALASRERRRFQKGAS